MKTKTKRNAAKIVGVLMILGLLLVVDAMVGDPISRAWANARAVHYAEKLYPGQTFIVKESSGGTLFQYGAQVQSQQSNDTNFNVSTFAWVSTTDDGNHVRMVEERYNTMYRQGEEAAAQAAQLLKTNAPGLERAPVYGAQRLPCEIDLGYTSQGESGSAAYAAQFALDTPFTEEILRTVPARFVTQVLWPTDPTQEDVQAVLQELKQVLEANGMPVQYYDVSLVPKQADTHDEVLSGLMVSGLVSAEKIQE